MSTGQMAPTANSVAASGAALLPQVLEKIFATLIYTPEGQSISNRSRAIKNVRRHAASLMVKIGFKYPLLLLPVFDQIRATVENLSRPDGPAHLSSMEKVTLQEALLLISNHFGDYDRQSNFVGEILREVNTRFLEIINAGACRGAAEFISFVGLDKPPVPSNVEDICGHNRSNLVFCVNLILGAVKRCSWPDDPERATRGGFVVSLTESGNPVCRNPAAPHVVPLLPHLMSLIKIFNELFTPDAQNLIHDSYKGCLTMQETEKSNLLGLIGHALSDNGDTQVVQSPLERMQRFLTGLHESCYHLVGSLGPSLGRDLYNIPDLGLAIINSVLSYLQYVPDYRIRPIIRVFLKPFIYSCPAPYYEMVLLPIMAHLTPIILSRLHTKWQQVIEFRNREAQEDNGDTQEVLEDILTRVLTREYLDLLKVALVGGSLTPESNSETMETEDHSMDSPPPHTRSNMTTEVISDLGLILLRSEKTCQSIVLTVLGALSWIDSNASLKATYLTGPIVRQLVLDNSLNGEMAAHIMAAVLNALTLHGQHEANQGLSLTLGAQIYELLRPSFLEVLAVMQQIPGVNPVDLQKLDERISGGTSKGNKIEKVKKDLFKKLTGNLIGRSVGQLFKKEVKIHDLPRIVIPKKTNQKDIIPDLKNVFIYERSTPYSGPNNVKYLGVHLDRTITWGHHIAETIRKAQNSSIRFSAESRLNLRNKLLLIKSIIQPQLIYASTAWGHACKTHLKRIQAVENIALRTAVSAPWFVRNRDLHRNLEWTPVQEVIKAKAAKVTTRIKKTTADREATLTSEHALPADKSLYLHLDSAPGSDQGYWRGRTLKSARVAIP
ncbi:hypothetical protein NQ315_016457 [Exocentrus adspersus]|uniref:Exportin-5 C-terminal domain-containing protein n=1 Tax=Exocentrus adspersus TaxID=1586481 RepID=A0AAV8VZ01_9CUCU|nr:hypothetical protein NQ315_016457 [Exocentrus adspersus]